MSQRPVLRCAIYTRKSSEEGLEQSFNSLQAQREACEAYIKSQAHEGWRAIPTIYDDGGFSGGNMDRPALNRLLADIGRSRIDVVVVYKVDRLTRSLADFARIIEILDARGVSFVSVTQQFNTTGSMGRLTLNVLLSFAQFEREVTGERIRDKFAASRKKGMWMGGHPPLGYDIASRKLVVNQQEAKQVRAIYERYLELSSVAALHGDLRDRQLLSKLRLTNQGLCRGGKPFSRGALYALLRNRVYLGEVVHKGMVYAGEHDPILERELWGRVQARLKDNGGERNRASPIGTGSLLAGLMFDDLGNRMSPSHARKQDGRRYRYYVSQAVLQHRLNEAGSVTRIPARAIEELVRHRIELLTGKASHNGAANKGDEPEPSPDQQLRSMLRRVVVGSEAVEIQIDRQSNSIDCSSLQAKLPAGDRLDEEDDVLVLRVQTRLRTRGGQRHIETPNGMAAIPRQRPDPKLIKALVRATQWIEAVAAGKVRSVAGIGRLCGLDERYVGQIIGLAFLAPDLVEAILEGRQAPRMTLAFVLRNGVPLSWHRQRRLYGPGSGTSVK